MAQGIHVVTRDFNLGVAPPDPGNRIFVVGPSKAPAIAGVCEAVTSRVPQDYVDAGGFAKGSCIAAGLVKDTGAAVTFIGFTAGTANTVTPIFETRTAGAVASPGLTLSFSSIPLDDLRCGVRFMNSGTIGTTGLSYKLTLDGGMSWSEVKALGTALSIPLSPYSESIVLTTGEAVAANTEFVAVCYSNIGGTSAIAAVTAAIASRNPGDAIYLASEESNATVASCAALVLAAEDKNRNLDLITECRDIAPLGSESVTTWGTAAAVQGKHVTNRKWSPCPGHYYAAGAFATSPILRRSAAYFLASRYLTNDVHVDPAHVSKARGSELTPSAIYSAPNKTDRIMRSPGATNDPDYQHDEEARPMFDALGLTSLYQIQDESGFFFYNARLQSAPGSDYDLVQMSRVMNKFRRVVYRAQRKYQHGSMILDKKTGTILESDASTKDAFVLAQLVAEMSENVTDVKFAYSRTDNVIQTKKLTSYGGLVPVGYAKELTTTVGFENPQIVAV